MCSSTVSTFWFALIWIVREGEGIASVELNNTCNKSKEETSVEMKKEIRRLHKN
jgi:hypothetical protein